MRYLQYLNPNHYHYFIEQLVETFKSNRSFKIKNNYLFKKDLLFADLIDIKNVDTVKTLDSKLRQLFLEIAIKIAVCEWISLSQDSCFNLIFKPLVNTLFNDDDGTFYYPAFNGLYPMLRNRKLNILFTHDQIENLPRIEKVKNEMYLYLKPYKGGDFYDWLDEQFPNHRLDKVFDDFIQRENKANDYSILID